MNSWILALITAFFAVVQSKSLLDKNELVERLLENLKVKRQFSHDVEKFFRNLKDKREDYLGTVCLDEDNRYYRVGEAFRMVDDCYFCRFDSKCNMQCKDDGFCSLKMCELLGKYYMPGYEVQLSTYEGDSCVGTFDLDCELVNVRC